MIECSTTTKPKARKEHRCDLCGRIIQVGTKYVRFSGKDNEDFFDVKLHTECDEIVKEYCIDECESEWDMWGVIDWLQCKLCDECGQRDDCEKYVIDCYAEKGGEKYGNDMRR